MEKYLVDGMLGDLARWMRLLGLDTAFTNRIRDEHLVELAKAEGRIIVTRDRRLARQKRASAGCLLITASRLPETLFEFLELSGNRPPYRLFTRCLACNGTLVPESNPPVGPRLPAFIVKNRLPVSRCTGCQRFYWPGTHRERMLTRLNSLGLAISDGLRPVRPVIADPMPGSCSPLAAPPSENR